MTQQQRKALYKQLTESPCPSWQAILTEATPSDYDLKQLKDQAASEAFQLIGLASYLSWRGGQASGDMGHEEAMRASEKSVQLARSRLSALYTNS